VRRRCVKGCDLAMATAISDPNEPFPPVMITVPVSDLPMSRDVVLVFRQGRIWWRWMILWICGRDLERITTVEIRLAARIGFQSGSFSIKMIYENARRNSQKA
jgi:hypothetical protein